MLVKISFCGPADIRIGQQDLLISEANNGASGGPNAIAVFVGSDHSANTSNGNAVMQQIEVVAYLKCRFL